MLKIEHYHGVLSSLNGSLLPQVPAARLVPPEPLARQVKSQDLYTPENDACN